MILREKMTIRRAIIFIIATFLFTYAMWGLVAINPSGMFPFGSPQAMIPYMLGGLSPTIVMFVLIKLWGQTKEERAFLMPIFRTKHGFKFTIIVTLLFIAVYLIIAIFSAERLKPWYMLIVNVPIMIIGGGLEEVGWRGFLQPALEKKLPFWLASLVVGIIWSAWHIPLWFISESNQHTMNFLIFMQYCIFLSYIIGALKRITDSVAASVFFHAWANVLTEVFAIDLIFSGNGGLLFSVLMTVFALAVVLIQHIAVYRFASEQ